MARRAPLRPQRPASRARDRFDEGDRFDLDLVVLPTVDGHRWDGLLYRPRLGDPARRRLAVLVVHGSVGNYLSGVPRKLSFALARAGFTVLSINTRMANYGVVFGEGLMHLAPLDIDAGMDLLRRLGHRRVVLCGYSLGATMVTSYQVARQAPEVAGVLTVAHALSLPAALRRRWERNGARPSYADVERRTRIALGDDPDDPDRDRIVVVRRGAGPSDRPEHAEVWTYRTWWFSRGPEAPHAVSADQVGLLRTPLAIIQAGEDRLVGGREGEDLACLARDGGCPAVSLAMVGGASHTFDRLERELGQLAEAWLATLV